jgi:hypothetical protein
MLGTDRGYDNFASNVRSYWYALRDYVENPQIPKLDDFVKRRFDASDTIPIDFEDPDHFVSVALSRMRDASITSDADWTLVDYDKCIGTSNDLSVLRHKVTFKGCSPSSTEFKINVLTQMKEGGPVFSSDNFRKTNLLVYRSPDRYEVTSPTSLFNEMTGPTGGNHLEISGYGKIKGASEFENLQVSIFRPSESVVPQYRCTLVRDLFRDYTTKLNPRTGVAIYNVDDFNRLIEYLFASPQPLPHVSRAKRIALGVAGDVRRMFGLLRNIFRSSTVVPTGGGSRGGRRGNTSTPKTKTTGYKPVHRRAPAGKTTGARVRV